MHHRCAHCITAENDLKNEIKSGEIILKDAEEVHLHHKNVRGFPFFFNSDNGAVSLGWPGNKQKLYQILNVSQMSAATFSGEGSGTYDESGDGSGTYYGSGDGSGTYHDSGDGSGTYHGSGDGSGTYHGSGRRPVRPAHFVKTCPQNRGGYLRLGETWSDRNHYIAYK
jgi:hypothetical protein